MTRTWATATDSQLRHAAAGVCGFFLEIKMDSESWEMPQEYEIGRWWCADKERKEALFVAYNPDDPWVDGTEDFDLPFWTPDRNRDQLARVFRSGNAVSCVSRKEFSRFDGAWLAALTDPRVSLIALLDLMNWPMPEETKQ